MSQDIIYVRNNRPNAVLVRVDGLKYTVERRGSRDDTAALPGDWRSKPPVSTFLHQGILEEISKDAYMALGMRPEDTIIEERGRAKKVPGVTDIALVERSASEVNIPINPEDHRQPTVITEENLRKTAPLRSPKPEFAGEVRTTEEDIAALKEAKSQAEAQVKIHVDENADLKDQIATLTALVQQLADNQQAQAKPAAKTAKKTTTGTAKRGRPAKKVTAANPMDETVGKEVITSADLME